MPHARRRRRRSRVLPRACRRPARARHIEVIDQRALPHAHVTARIADADAAALAIRRMIVRGAPLIGAVGAYGLALALERDASDVALGARACRARRDAADRGQPALGARPRAARGGVAAAVGARRRRVARGRRHSRGGRRDQSRDRPARPRAPARHRAPPLRPHQRDDPLQCRGARDLRLGHGDRAAVPRARRGPSAARLGQRDAPAPAGREPDGVGDAASAASRIRCSSMRRAAS